MRFTIDESIAGQRLDKALALLNPTLTRNYISLCIDQGLVCINDKKIIKPSTKLKQDDQVDLQLLPSQKSEVIAQDIPLDILYEDQDIIVINKPKDMVVHPSVGHNDNTLVNALLAHCTDLSGINGEKRPGIVHRLDKDTSGVMVICKNDVSHNDIAQQFKDHTLDKYYIALVDGVINEQAGRINAPIGRDKASRLRMCVSESGKPAITEFKVLQRFTNHTLIQCHLLTGRTHQIRVHMAYINHPVTNDPIYGKVVTNQLNGQFLHSNILELTHPTTKQKMKFEALLPQSFIDAYQSLENL